MPYFSNSSKVKLATCDGELRRLFEEVIHHFDCKIICGHRSQAAQNTAYNNGFSKLKWPESCHNDRPSQAIDVVPWPINWNDTDRMRFFAGFVLGIAHNMGIRVRWGGDWDSDTELSDQTFMDLPHFELKGS